MTEDPTRSSAPLTTASERRAILRIDAAPSGKKFQGVWLELPGDRWVIDYRAREVWKAFEDAAVIVSGACYEPFGQAIHARHFRVDRLRFATPPARGERPFLEVGPETMLDGTFVEHTFPAGSKLAGSSERMFVAAGEHHGIVAINSAHPAAGTVARIKARAVVPDLSYMAQTGGPKLWILAVHAADYVEDPAHAPRVVPCPE